MEETTPANPIRLLLVDPQALFRASLSRYLAAQSGIEVAGECGTTAEALEMLRQSPVDLVLLDVDDQAERGEDLIAAALRSGYQGRFLLVAGEAGAKDLAAAIQLGASGIFLKSEGPDRLVQAIRLVTSGAIWVDRKAIQHLADELAERPHLTSRASGNPLTEREERVLLGILGGLTNRKIGENIGLSEGAVKSVVQQLFLRAGVRTRSQLVRMALEGSLGAAREQARRGPAVVAEMPADSPEILQPIASNAAFSRPPHG